MFYSISNFVEQLITAELFFALGFVILIGFIISCYFLGAAAERSWALMKQEAHKHFTHLRGRWRHNPYNRATGMNVQT